MIKANKAYLDFKDRKVSSEEYALTLTHYQFIKVSTVKSTNSV